MSGEMGGGSFTVTTGLKRTHGNQNADDKSPLLSTPLLTSLPLPNLPLRLTFPTYLGTEFTFI
jgi:hypothetical protein